MSLLDSILSGMDATYKKQKVTANTDPIRQIQLAAAEQKKKALSEWRQSVRQRMDVLLKDTLIHHIIFSPQEEDTKRFIIDEEAQELDLVSIKINDSTAASNLVAHLRSAGGNASSTVPADDEKSRVGLVGSIVVFKKGHEPNLENPTTLESEEPVNVDKVLSQLRKPVTKPRSTKRKKAPALPAHGDNLIVLGTNKRDLRSIEQKMLDMKKRKKSEPISTQGLSFGEGTRGKKAPRKRGK